MKVFYKVAGMDEPPFRLILHPVAVKCAEARIESIQSAVEGFKEWSEEIF